MKKTLLVFASALTLGGMLFPSVASAHQCDLPHRHYAGRVFYIVCNRYYEPVWCDGWGTLRTLGARKWEPRGARLPQKGAARGETPAASGSE